MGPSLQSMLQELDSPHLFHLDTSCQPLRCTQRWICWTEAPALVHQCVHSGIGVAMLDNLEESSFSWSWSPGDKEVTTPDASWWFDFLTRHGRDCQKVSIIRQCLKVKFFLGELFLRLLWTHHQMDQPQEGLEQHWQCCYTWHIRGVPGFQHSFQCRGSLALEQCQPPYDNAALDVLYRVQEHATYMLFTK